MKEDLLAVMEKVKRASVFFADSQGAPAAVVKEVCNTRMCCSCCTFAEFNLILTQLLSFFCKLSYLTYRSALRL